MNVETYNVTLSLDQPDNASNSLLTLLQQIQGQFRAKALQRMPDFRNLLIIDSDGNRAQHLARLLSMYGYRPLVMANALGAFTRFLQVPFVPFAILLDQDDTSNRLFLHRLLQQVLQRYEWEIPLICLHIQPSRTPSLITQVPVSQSQSLSPFSSTPLPRPSHFLTSSQATLGIATDEEGLTPPSLPPISLEGQNLGRYHILSAVGDKSTNTVYKTYDRLREQDVALKALRTDAIPYRAIEHQQEEDNLFQQEADLLHGIKHPHIVPVWNCGKSYVSGVSFIYKTMLYCQGESLVQWLYQHGKHKSKGFTVQEVGHIILQLADALQYLHDHQVTFQNFKLSNLLLRKSVDTIERMHIMLSDMAIPQDGTFFSRATESFAYIAPERWLGQASPASDQYGLAVIAYELLAGRQPFQGNAARIMKLLHMNMVPQPPSVFNAVLPPSVDSVILRGLAKRPEERFGTVALFARAFQKYCL